MPIKYHLIAYLSSGGVSMKRTIEGGRAAWEMKVHAKYTSVRRQNFLQMVFCVRCGLSGRTGGEQESGRRRSALYGDDRRKKTSSVL